MFEENYKEIVCPQYIEPIEFDDNQCGISRTSDNDDAVDMPLYFPEECSFENEKFGSIEVYNSSLNNDEMQELNAYYLRKIKSGDQEALAHLVYANSRLVWKIVQKYSVISGMLDAEDLFQVGVIGLMKAAEKFDFSFGTRFSTYAVWWIRQSIVRDISNHGSTIRIPSYALEKMNHIISLKNKYMAEGFTDIEII